MTEGWLKQTRAEILFMILTQLMSITLNKVTKEGIFILKDKHPNKLH